MIFVALAMICAVLWLLIGPPAEMAKPNRHSSSTILAAHTKSGTAGEVVREAVVAHRSGPLPDAGQLQEYENVVPGLAVRIVEMAEREQASRHQGDRAAEEHARQQNEIVAQHSANDYQLKTRGQYMGCGALLLVLGLAAAMVYVGSPGSAAGMVATVAASLIWGLPRRAKTVNSSGQNAGDGSTVA